MITKLSHATIYVTDHVKAYDFYVNKLGFRVGTDFVMDNGFRWLTIAAPQQPDVEIVLYKAAPGMMDPESLAHIDALLTKGNGMGGGVFATDDCPRTYDELRAKGVVFMQPPTKQFYGIEALFTDGCGNWFSLTQRTV
jgi:catechol 2,3-dioxygenase-like lactoylglutathione lyase family enzyme